YYLDRVPALVEELEARRVDIIVTHAAATYDVVKHLRTVPVVYEFSADPISLGIATDLAHPLYNATGITLMMAEMNGKRRGLLHATSPHVGRAAVRPNHFPPDWRFGWPHLEPKEKNPVTQAFFFPTPGRGDPGPPPPPIAADPPQAIVAFSDAFVVETR